MHTKPNRASGPPIHTLGELIVPEWTQTILLNGTQLIEVNMGSQRLVSMEIIHYASRKQEDKKGVGRAVARLLREGTKELSSKEIAEQVDYYGATLSAGANLDFSFIKLFSLTKHFSKLLPIVEQVRYSPAFPEEELARYKKNSIQRLAVDDSKVELRAYKILTESLFGEEHIYGYNSTEDIYNALSREDLVAHFEDYYGSTNCTIVLSGKIDDDIRNAVIDTFGKSEQQVNVKPYILPKNTSFQTQRITGTAVDKSQTGIKIGTRLWNRNHEDFSGMFVLNTVLGGYFGSRLMSKIREEKGYTYSIYSGLDMLRDDGYFFVSTEVSDQYTEATMQCIYEEMEKLQNELISEQELTTIKNYLRGNFLNMIDGPFKVSRLAKLTDTNQLDKYFFRDLSKYVKDVSSEQIRAYAQKYLNKEHMLEVVIGG